MPVFGVDGDCILSKGGDLTLGYRVMKPEIFTLSVGDYEKAHNAFVRALKVLPPHSVVHMMDWYSRISYQPGPEEGPAGWLGLASDRFFNEREWLDHHAYLFLTRRVERPWSDSLASLLVKPRLVARELLDEQSMNAFREQCGQFVKIIADAGSFVPEPLTKEDIWSEPGKAGLIERYCSLEQGTYPVLKDVGFREGIQVGELYTRLYTLGDVQDLPDRCGVSSVYDPYSTEQTQFPIGFASGVGPLLPCNHICSQFIFIGREEITLKKLEKRKLRLQALSAYSRANAVARDAIDELLNESVREGKQLVKAHFNILCWSDRQQELSGIHNGVSAALSRMGATPRIEITGAPQIWAAGIPGNAGDFPMNEAFDVFADQAACFTQWEGNYRSSAGTAGLRLGDRVTGRPIQVDIDHEPRRKALIGNYNAVVVSGSGGGKSFTLNALFNSYFLSGAHVLIIDVGHSYELQCQMHGGKYFTFEEGSPLVFNPFKLGIGESFDIEKKESLKALLLALWKRPEEEQRRSEYVALSKALQLYFDRLQQDQSILPCFDSFYEFLQTEFASLVRKGQIKERDFDLSNFLFVLSPYYKGGEFDYLLNATENYDLLQQRFIVFELDAIKDNPILYPIVTLVIMELATSKMRKLKDVFKVFGIEEAWKPIAEKGMGGFMLFLEKTARKFYTKIIVCTQEIEDMTSSEILKNSIVNNSDTVILLDQSKLMNNFDDIQRLFGITEKQKAEVLSLNRGREAGRHYKDVWIRLGPSYSRVYRLEVSDEEYCIYTSEKKEKVIIKEYIRRHGTVKAGVSAFIREAREKGGWLFLLAVMVVIPGLVRAQDIPIIGIGVSKVVKALDLQVQRIQTQTIWLEEAQKVVENAMSQLHLADIRDWVTRQRDLYQAYFQELWQVKSAVDGYHRVTELVRREEQIVSQCRLGFQVFSRDGHFSPEELAGMEKVYAGMLKEASDGADLLLVVVKSFSTQMSDEGRLGIINKVADRMEQVWLDLSRYNNQNMLLSQQRSAEREHIDLLKKIYGL